MAELRFVSFLAERMLPLYEAVSGGIASALGVKAELVQGQTYDTYANDRYDVAFVCGLPYVLSEQSGSAPSVPVAAPVVSGTRYGGRPIYSSDVVVRIDSPYQSFNELRGACWAYNEPTSHSGYGIARYHLAQLGKTNGFFGGVIRSGSHADSIRMVLSGEAAGAAIDSHLLDVIRRQEPELETQLRIIDSLGPSTIQPMVVSPHMAPTARTEISDAATELHHQTDVAAAMADWLVTKWVRVEESSYDDIRAMVGACEAVGFSELR